MEKSNIQWQELKPSNLPEQGIWILITDGIDWRRVYVTNQFEFVENPDSSLAYNHQSITHWCKVILPECKHPDEKLWQIEDKIVCECGNYCINQNKQ